MGEQNKEAWMKAAKVNAEIIQIKKREITGLKADLESMKEEKCRHQREVKNLLAKLEGGE